MSMEHAQGTTAPAGTRQPRVDLATRAVLISDLERRVLSDLQVVACQLPTALRTRIGALFDTLDTSREALTHEEVRTGLAALRWRMGPLFGAEVDAIDRVLRHCSEHRFLPDHADPDSLAELCDLAFAGLSLAFQERVVFGEPVDEVPRWTRLEERLREALDRCHIPGRP
jgi:hypothetical protein